MAVEIQMEGSEKIGRNECDEREREIEEEGR